VRVSQAQKAGRLFATYVHVYDPDAEHPASADVTANRQAYGAARHGLTS
jgi:hypothetical protein